MASILGVETLQHTNGTDAITIDSSGNVVLPQVGTGAFYRTGTFTPEYSTTAATDPTAGILSGTYVLQIGEYVRIGDLVHADIVITSPTGTASYINGGATGQNLTIVGLPFRVKNLTDYNASATVGWFSGYSAWSAGYTPMGYAGYNTKRIIMGFAIAGGFSNATTNVVVADGSATTILHITYQTDEA